MNTSEAYELSLCEDCLMIAANGREEEGLYDIEWPNLAGWIVNPGHLHNVEDCGEDVMAGTADCPYDEGSFSWSPCDACKRPQGGTCYPASAFQIA